MNILFIYVIMYIYIYLFGNIVHFEGLCDALIETEPSTMQDLAV